MIVYCVRRRSSGAAHCAFYAGTESNLTGVVAARCFVYTTPVRVSGVGFTCTWRLVSRPNASVICIHEKKTASRVQVPRRRRAFPFLAVSRPASCRLIGQRSLQHR